MINYPSLLLLFVLNAPVFAAPVHVSLKSAASISANADGFFTLASVAQLTGGDASQRTRLAAIEVGRAPLSGETRQLTLGDLALKLRQAGFDPDRDVSLEGAGEAMVTTALEPGLERPGCSEKGPPGLRTSTPDRLSPYSPALSAPGILLHSGSLVTILIQSGAMTITAPGIARESGAAGDSIRVHRDNVMTDLTVTVLDAQTVRLEI